MRPRPLVLLCDVSGSMERYSRMLLHFAHAVTQPPPAGRDVPVLDAADASHAAASRRPARTRRWPRCRESVTGLVGRDAHRRRRSRSSISDGAAACCTAARSCCSSPTGGTAAIRRSSRDQIARLQRSCHRLIWLNPLIGTADYAPLTRGLQAALPFVDDFLPARTLNNLADLALHLNALADRRRRALHGYLRLLHVQRAARSGLGRC